MSTPDDEKLRAISNISFSNFLSDLSKHLVVEEEKRRQEASPVQSAENSDAVPGRAAKPSANVANNKHDWHVGHLRCGRE